MRTHIPLVVVLTLVGVIAACDFDATSEPVLLRFTPVVGKPIAYEISVNLDKTTYGRKSNENVSAVSVMTPESREDDGYRMTMTVHLNSHNMDELVAEHMERRANAGKSLTVSDAFVFSGDDGPNLFLPDVPVAVGDSWEADDVFKVGDLTTLKPPRVRLRFIVNQFSNEGDHTLAHIGVALLTRQAKVPFQMGQAGIRCNENGTVVELSGAAAKKLRVGDHIVAIAGKRASDPRTRSILAQNFIEDLGTVNEPVRLTIERDGQTLEVSVEKHVISLGTIRATFDDYTRTSIFDADAGLLVSDDSTATITFHYTIDPEMDFLDDLSGGHGSWAVREMAGKGENATPPRIYEYHWKMNRVK